MGDEYEIIDPSKKHNWRTEIPNMIDDLGLSPAAVRLYLRLKRVAGDDGSCWQTTRTLAKACKMSTGQVAKAKKELLQAGLIEKTYLQAKHGHFSGHNITIVDIWIANYQKYAQSSGKPPVHILNASGSPEGLPSGSPGEIEEDPSSKRDPIAKNGAAVSMQPSDTPEKPSGVSKKLLAATASDTSLKSHPAIQAIKEVTHYYPPKDLYKHITERIGPNPDKSLMWRIHQFMLLKGYNPRNWSNFLDRYEDRLRYIHSDDRARLDAMQNPYEVAP